MPIPQEILAVQRPSSTDFMPSRIFVPSSIRDSNVTIIIVFLVFSCFYRLSNFFINLPSSEYV